MAVEKFIIQEGGRVLLLPPALSEAQLRLALAPYTDIRVWHFKDPLALWVGHWADPAQGRDFDVRVRHMIPNYTG